MNMSNRFSRREHLEITRAQLLTFLIGIAATFAGPQLASVCAQKAGDVKTEKRSLKSTAGELIEYEIGTLFVPENRGEAASRVIGVGFARFPATVQPLATPPVFQLPGGPGDSYLTRPKSTSTDEMERRFALASLRAFCDVVFVDQRGFSERGDVLTATFHSPATTR